MGGFKVTSEQVTQYYDTHSNITKATNIHEVFRSNSINTNLDPALFKNGIRESCDSAGCPKSRAIAIGFDETGSMGEIPFYFVKSGFPTLIDMIQGDSLGYDPQIAVVGIGDVKVDRSSLQFSQFEADTRMIDNLPLFHIEGGGGANNGESYNIPWWTLAMHTKIDCFNKRGEKGIYISIGDDKSHPTLSCNELTKVFGNRDGLEEYKISTKQIRDMALERWHLFHILIKKNWDYYNGYASSGVEESWRSLLGNHIAILEDYTCVAELIATMLKIQSGVDKFEAIQMIENVDTRKVIREALIDFEPYDEPHNDKSDAHNDSIEFI